MKSLHLLVTLVLLNALSSALFAEEKVQSLKTSESIMIVDYTAKNLSVPDAINLVVNLSKKSDPAGKGVEVLFGPDTNATTLPAINLNLKAVPVYDILRIISALSGLEMKFEEKAVFLVQKKSDPKD